MDIESLERRLAETYQDLFDRWVDPREAIWDEPGEWTRLGAAAGSPANESAFMTETQHLELRERCRALAVSNEFAINGHENRISYLVGSGHAYRVTACEGGTATPAMLRDAQRLIDAFVEVNRWQQRQQEIVRRCDRDGEAFLRFFVASDGTTRVRFVEPGQIATPVEMATNPAASFGILVESDDVETPIAYFIDGQPVDASEIQHRKANVDANVKRGLPLFYPVMKNLRRAEKLLRNMSVVAEIQSAIALIRRHRAGTRSGVQQFVAGQADVATHSASGGQARYFQQFGPGTILDTHGGVEYDFPVAGINAATYVTILQAELRAIAARLVMPEFMLTSDASNANYASTMVAEGPAIRMFARAQAELVADDLQVMWRVVRNAVVAGRLERATLDSIEIQASPPSLAVRNQLQEDQALRIEYEAGILSPQTWSLRRGLDYGQEQANLSAHRAAHVASGQAK